MHTARHIQPRVEAALRSFRVVLLHGARQSGKTTLARLVVENRGGTYATLDDDATLRAVLEDPVTFLTSQKFPLAIDEVQLGGDRVVRAVKRIVDEDPQPGRFLLTGSTNFLTVPTISESLAGRVCILRLWPLSEAELAGAKEPVIPRCFDDPPRTVTPEALDRNGYLERVCRGGYPEVIVGDPSFRSEWFNAYVETVVQRDLVALADIRKAGALSRLLAWTAAGTANEMNIAAASAGLGMNRSTVGSYLEWLRSVFLIHELPVYSRNFSTRAARRPKLHMSDTGLAADLSGVSAEMLAKPTTPVTGPLLESFVVNEVLKQLSSSEARVAALHYRDQRGHEVDLVLERRDGPIVAVEIKATSSPGDNHLKNLSWLRDKTDAVTPGTFRAGVLLHTGPQTLKVGDRLHLAPISTLWAE